MTIRVNGEAREIAVGATLADVVRLIGSRVDAVAVARNGEVVPRARLETEAAAEGDTIEVIRAVGGG